MPRGWELYHGRSFDNLYWHWAGSSSFGGDVPVNPTSGVIPWNNAGTFDDSNLLRRNTSTTDLRYLVDGTIAQIFRIYKTSDNGIASPTNYERIVFDSDTANNVFRIHTQAGGTGVVRPINLGHASGANAVPIGINASPGSLPTDGIALQIGFTQATPTNDIGIYFEGVALQTGDFIQANSPSAGGVVFRLASNGSIFTGLSSAVTGTITFRNSGNANTQTISGSAAASSVTYLWPADNPVAGEVLLVTSFGAGIAALEWAPGGSITAPGFTTQLIRNAAGVFGAISGVTSDGTNVTAGDGNLRATSPLITTGLDDSNGNTIIGLTATGSAVNFLNATNAAAGNGPTLAAAGSDTNIQLNISSKGAGNIQFTANGGSTSEVRYALNGGNIFFTTQQSPDSYPQIRFGGQFGAGEIGGNIGWTNDTGPGSGAVDTCLGRGGNSASCRITGPNRTEVGVLFVGQFVSPQTSATVTVTAVQSGTVFTNEGASAGVNFNLPTAAARLAYIFIVQDADGITVTANTGDTIRLAGSVSASAGNINSTTIGSAVALVAINATEWVAYSVVGTWTVT